ncbi:MAG: PilZ domain-containing protein [Candidatus Saccharibacteria bacterium]
MEGRNSYRLELRTELALMLDQIELHGEVVNVGLSGILAKIDQQLDSTDPYRITFQLKPDKTQVKSWARVAWSQEHAPGEYLVGLQFERIDSAVYRNLADYISGRWIKEHLSPGSYDSAR